MANRFANGKYVIDLGNSAAVAGACNVANPEGIALLITGAHLDITGASSSSGITLSINIGTASSSGTAASLFDGLATTVAGLFSNYSSGNAGTSGVPAALWSSGNYVVGSFSSGAPTTSWEANLILSYLPRST